VCDSVPPPRVEKRPFSRAGIKLSIDFADAFERFFSSFPDILVDIIFFQVVENFTVIELEIHQIFFF